MRFVDRYIAVKGKLWYFSQEVEALRHGGLCYALAFGFIMALLFPVLIFEIIVLLLFGLDLGIMQTREVEALNEIRQEEVPNEFLSLIPLAEKWGIGDSEEREARINDASIAELKHLEEEVGPKMQQIADWLDSYSENELGSSVTAGYFLFLQIAYEEASEYLEQYKTQERR